MTTLATPPHELSELGERGFAVIRAAVSPASLSALHDATRELRVESGLRFALHHLPAARQVTLAALLPLARTILGNEAVATRSILFDKTATSNWLVPWHQDLTIAVTERREVPGYGPWSAKEGTPHVQPPVSVLERMVTLRLHLDDTPATNGALRVLPGSHARGVIATSEILPLRAQGEEVTLEVTAGDLVVMRPLTLHASSKSTRPTRRRVLHVEFAGCALDGGLDWAERVSQ